MKCDEFTARLDDYLDGGQDERAMREHLSACEDCRRLHEHAAAVLAAVRRLSPPEVHPEFVDRAIARATRSDEGVARSGRRAALGVALAARDRKSTRLNSSHLGISYDVCCLQQKTNTTVGRLRPAGQKRRSSA